MKKTGCWKGCLPINLFFIYTLCRHDGRLAVETEADGLLQRFKGKGGVPACDVCLVRTCPRPLQRLQKTGCVPGAAPRPTQSGHVLFTDTCKNQNGQTLITRLLHCHDSQMLITRLLHCQVSCASLPGNVSHELMGNALLMLRGCAPPEHAACQGLLPRSPVTQQLPRPPH